MSLISRIFLTNNFINFQTYFIWEKILQEIYCHLKAKIKIKDLKLSGFLVKLYYENFVNNTIIF